MIGGVRINQRDIVFIPFRYSDSNTEFKIRPALIISNNKYNENYDDVIVCAITSSQETYPFVIEISESDLETSKRFKKPSRIKYDSIGIIDKKKYIQSIWGRVKKDVFKKVILGIFELIKLEPDKYMELKEKIK